MNTIHKRALLLTVGLFLALTPAAAAAGFPDLPGMGSAERVTPEAPEETDAAPTTEVAAAEAPAPEATEPAPEADTDAAIDPAPILSLPGAGVLADTIEVGVASTGGMSTMTVGLVGLAALGTLIATTMAYMALRGRFGIEV